VAAGIGIHPHGRKVPCPLQVLLLINWPSINEWRLGAAVCMCMQLRRKNAENKHAGKKKKKNAHRMWGRRNCKTTKRRNGRHDFFHMPDDDVAL
jgi:hypothetical protein